MTTSRNAKRGKRSVTVSEGDQVVTVSKGKRSVTVAEGDEELTVTKGKQTVTVEGDTLMQVKTGKHIY